MRTYTHYPHAFSVSIFPYFIKCRQFIVAVYFSFSIIKSNLLKLPDFNDISISQQLLNSVYVGNAGEPSVRFFFPWLFCRLLLNLYITTVCYISVYNNFFISPTFIYFIFCSILYFIAWIDDELLLWYGWLTKGV